MLKGHTKIILTDVKTGKQEVHEDNNLITNAIDKIINCEIAMNHYPNDYLLPIATKLLGGIMLFDEELTESADNIHFPVEAHLLGYAGQSTNTTDKYRGSYNSGESGRTPTGYKSVWDFGTNQGNGEIKAIARTHSQAGTNPLFYYLSPTAVSTPSGNPTTDTRWYPIRYDGEYVYMLKGNTSTHQMRLARARIPMLRMGVGDYSDVGRTYEVIASWSTDVFTYTYTSGSTEREETAYADDPVMYEDGHDGYIYCMCHGVYNRTSQYQYDLNYFTINYGDGSYEKSEPVHERLNHGYYANVNYTNYYAYPGRVYGHVNNGVYYYLSGNRKSIICVPLDNLAAYRSIKIIADSSSDYIYALDYACPHNGGVYFEVYHYTTSSYNYLNGFLYPDGVFVLPSVSYGGTGYNHGNNASGMYYLNRTLDDDLTAWEWYDDTVIRKAWTANYLGTINNLASPIIKTAAQTMKIVYTLTDVDENDTDTE